MVESVPESPPLRHPKACVGEKAPETSVLCYYNAPKILPLYALGPGNQYPFFRWGNKGRGGGVLRFPGW